MKVLVFDTVKEASQKAYEVFQESLNSGSKVFGLATGSTPEKLYDIMVQSDIDFTQATSINLDEYNGLAGDHPQSYYFFMNEHLFNEKPLLDFFCSLFSLNMLFFP